MISVEFKINYQKLKLNLGEPKIFKSNMTFF